MLTDDRVGLASKEFTELVLEKVRFGMSEYASTEMLSALRFDVDTIASDLSKHIIYNLTGFLWGRQVREDTVVKKIENEENVENDPEEIVVDCYSRVPLTWKDHLIDTYRAYCYSMYEKSIEKYDPLSNYMLWRLSCPWRTWLRMCWKSTERFVKYRNIDKDIRYITNQRIMRTTKHIEIHKHWHTCPHLHVVSDKLHSHFLQSNDDGRMRL